MNADRLPIAVCFAVPAIMSGRREGVGPVPARGRVAAAASRWLARKGFAVAVGVLGIVSAIAAAQMPSLPIIVYHQIRDSADGPPDSVDAISLMAFESQMRHLHEQGYVTLSADEVVEFLRGGKPLGARIVSIHFDDGWKSSQLALPVLDRYGFKATFWVIAGAGIGSPHMDWEEIQAIGRNPRFDIHSHSMTHPWKAGDTMLDWMNGRTAGKGPEQVRWELVESRRVLEEKLIRPVRYLAWPAGHYDQAMIRIATESGYLALFTIDSGVNGPGADLLRVRRTMVHGGCGIQSFAQILRDGIYRDCDAVAAGNAQERGAGR